jgi:cardiolipin synthase
MMRHVPNLLSALRLLAAPLAAWLIVHNHDIAALCVFGAAGASDGLDGMIARRFGFTSDFGAWLDPAADKLLMLLCFTALYGAGATPVWLLALVVARDAAIAGGWLMIKAAALPIPAAPLRIGKASTLVQILYIGLMLLLLAFDLVLPGVSLAAAVFTGFVTVVSGVAYAQVFLRGVFHGGRPA